MSSIGRIVLYFLDNSSLQTMELNQLPPLFVGMFSSQINLLKLIGIDVFDKSDGNFLKKYVRITIFSSFLMCMMLGQFLYVIEGNKIGATFLDIVNAIPGIFMVIQVTVKVCVVIHKKNQIREIIIDIGKEWPECTDEEKIKELQKWTNKLRIFDNAFFRAAAFSVTCFTVSPMLITIYKFYTAVDVKYEFILQVYYFCELNSNFKYAIVYLHQAITCTISDLCVYVTCDFLLVDLMFALSSLLSLVQIDLRNLKLASIIRSSDDDCNDIKIIVKKHQNLLRYSEKLNDIFGPLIFVQVSTSSIEISCYGFLAIEAGGMFLRNITVSCGVIFAIFVLAWPGQMLIDMSSGVAEAAYQCRWYKRSNEFRKYISIIITRSQKPCQVSALGFANLSLTMFSKVLSTSWSYLSLLHQMYEDFDFN